MATSTFIIMYMACVIFLLDSTTLADTRPEMISMDPLVPALWWFWLMLWVMLETSFYFQLLWFWGLYWGFLQCTILECRALGKSFLFLRAWARLCLLWKNLAFKLFIMPRSSHFWSWNFLPRTAVILPFFFLFYYQNPQMC